MDCVKQQLGRHGVAVEWLSCLFLRERSLVRAGQSRRPAEIVTLALRARLLLPTSTNTDRESRVETSTCRAESVLSELHSIVTMVSARTADAACHAKHYRGTLLPSHTR